MTRCLEERSATFVGRPFLNGVGGSCVCCSAAFAIPKKKGEEVIFDRTSELVLETHAMTSVGPWMPDLGSLSAILQTLWWTSQSSCQLVIEMWTFIN